MAGPTRWWRTGNGPFQAQCEDCGYMTGVRQTHDGLAAAMTAHTGATGQCQSNRKQVRGTTVARSNTSYLENRAATLRRHVNEAHDLQDDLRRRARDLMELDEELATHMLTVAQTLGRVINYGTYLETDTHRALENSA